jgi:hypothetical protein
MPHCDEVTGVFRSPTASCDAAMMWVNTWVMLPVLAWEPRAVRVRIRVSGPDTPAVPEHDKEDRRAGNR